MSKFIKRLRNIKSIELTFRRTGDKVPTWMILFIVFSLIFAIAAPIYALYLYTNKDSNYFKKESYYK